MAYSEASTNAGAEFRKKGLATFQLCLYPPPTTVRFGNEIFKNGLCQTAEYFQALTY